MNNKRSLRSMLVEIALKAKPNKALKTKNSAKKYMIKRSFVEDEALKANLKRYNGNVKLVKSQGLEVLTFGNGKSPKNIILYIHGGAYVNEITYFHIKFLDKLSKQSNSYIIAPIYKLAPNHTYVETYHSITKIYKNILNNFSNSITLMGDSAGGGFAISFCQYIQSIGLTLPKKLVCFSPWLDVSMSNKHYDEYIKKDPMLAVPGSLEMGKAWAGDLDLKDPKLSPMFGDNSALPTTLLFVGTHEIFYPDVIVFKQKLVESGVEVRLVIGEKMNHVYPIYPIPEAEEAITQVIDFLLK